MNGPQFFQTGYGRRFFDGQLPSLIKVLGRIAVALEAIAAEQASDDEAWEVWSPDDIEDLGEIPEDQTS